MSFFGSLFGTAAPGNSRFWHSLGHKTKAGKEVSEWNAATLPVVYSCVGIISDAVSQLPLEVFRDGAGESIERDRLHPVYRLLNRRPNDRMTAFTFRNTAQHHTLLWGNGYAEIERTQGGVPTTLWPALPDRTWPDLMDDGSVLYHTTIDRETKTLESSDVLHIPALGFDGVVGYSPVALARQAIGLGLAMEEFAAKFFGDGAKSGVIFKHPGKLGPEAIKRIRESWAEQGGLGNSHGAKVVEEGMTVESITIPPEEAQFIEGRHLQIAEVARLYRIPLHMVQSHEKSTTWGSGVESLARGFVDYTLLPWLIRWEQEINEKMFTAREKDQGYHVRHDVSALLRGDSKSRSEYYTRALDSDTGWMLRNEVREKEEMNPVEASDWQQENGNAPQDS